MSLLYAASPPGRQGDRTGGGEHAPALQARALRLRRRGALAEARLGDWRAFVGILCDLTDRKRTEERFRLTVESTPNAIVLINAAGAIVMVNAQTEKFFGYRRDELIGQPVEVLVPAVVM